MRNPTFPQGEIDLMKANTAQRLQAQAGVAAIREQPAVPADAVRRASVRPHRASRPKSLPAIDRDAIVDYHQTYYRPNNAFLVVVGDVTPDAVFEAAEKAFGELGAAGRAGDAKPSGCRRSRGARWCSCSGPTACSQSISVGNFTPARNDARWYTLQLANQIFGAAFDSRLVRNIREEKGYTYSPQSLFQAMEQGGLYRAVADVRNDVTGATLKEIYAEIDKLRAGGPEAEELSDAKQYARGLFVIQNATQTGLAQHAQHGEHLRAAEGLSGDVPAPDLAAVGRSGEDRRARCCSAPRTR